MPRTTLRADPASAAAARRFVADVLWQRGFPNDGIEDAVLLTSEAVTNAVVHARSPVQLVVTADGSMARVEIYDQHPRAPVPKRLEPEAPSGRGLHVIQAVAEAWGVERSPGRGKCLWFELRS